MEYIHRVKSVHIRRFPGPRFPAFGLDTEICMSVFNLNAGKCVAEKKRM